MMSSTTTTVVDVAANDSSNNHDEESANLLAPLHPLNPDEPLAPWVVPLTEQLIPQQSPRERLVGVKPRVYTQRWVQLGYLSLLALLSDWICFSLAAAPEAFEEYYDGKSSASLIDMFLFINVASSFAVTDVVAKFGMRSTILFAAALMTVGCWFRSGLDFFGQPEDEDNMLVPYPCVVIGTLLVGAAQPFFQCTPPLLSAQWFASDERATSTAVALNFNQIGIATAFLVGGNMATTTNGLRNYFGLIAILSTIIMIGTFLQFQEKPPTPPSSSELEKILKGKHEPPFRVSVKKFFTTKGFTRPLAAFICSISITNIVGAFIDEVMDRGGITNKFHVALAGAAFEFAIVIGGIIIGGYVDRTKRYKRVTQVCLAVSLVLLIPLGLTEHAFGASPVILVMSLIGLGLMAGPIQPINAELAVDVTFPGDEVAVESVQQIGGNLISALLVPAAARAAKADYQLLSNVPALASDIRGDVVLLLVVTAITYCYFSGFNAPLRRSIADRNDDDGREDGVELLPNPSFSRGEEEEEDDNRSHQEMGKLLERRASSHQDDEV